MKTLLAHSAQCGLKLSSKPILLAETIRPPHAVYLSISNDLPVHYYAFYAVQMMYFIITLVSL